jgi:hypothetical protein
MGEDTAPVGSHAGSRVSSPAVEDTDLDDVLAPGTIVADKYAVVRLLGRGGMGIVVEARHLRLGQSVALKLLKSSVRRMGEVTARFEREGRAAARLQGPHVARILDIDALPDDGSPFMVMELLRGRELGEELEARGTLPIREAVGYILQACAGMAEAHRAGIVHRDLKPSNLFLCDHDGRRTVKVLDFGISKLIEDVQASMTTTATAFGTPLYMSPEQVRSAKHVDVRTDVWSLGVVLYELLAAEPPFNGASATGILAAIIADKPVRIEERRPEVPAGLAKAVMKALEKDPNARFADIREFATAIAPYGPPRDDPSLVAVAAELAAPRAPTPHGGTRAAATATTGSSGTGLSLSGSSPRQRLVLGVAGLAVVLSIVTLFVVASRKAPGSPTAALDPPVPTQTTATQTVGASAPVLPPASTPPAVPDATIEPARPSAVPSTAPGAPSGTRRKPTVPSAAPSAGPAPSGTRDPIHL